MEKKLFLLDAYALIFRSYYAFIRNPRINSKGLNTSAIFGFVNSLEEVLKKEDPTHIAVVFDPPGPTFRNEMYSEYKANRDATPEDIRKAVPYIKDILKAYNIPVVEKEGYEADDVVGTLARMAADEDFTVYMMTSDKDYAQLVTDKVFMYRPRRSGEKDNQVLKVPEILRKFSIEKPEQVIDILALWGDSADNVPGAPGVGEKTAIKLIDQFGSVENLLDNTDQLKGKQKEKIEANKAQILLSKKLVTIEQEVPLNVDFSLFKYDALDKEQLKPIFDELEFNTLSQRILGEPAKVMPGAQGSLFDFPTNPTETEQEEPTSGKRNVNTENPEYILVDTPYLRKNLISELSKSDAFAVDTETNSLNPHIAKLTGMSFCVSAGKAWYVMMPETEKEKQAIVDEFKPVLENSDIMKIGQNIKYDMLVLRNYNISIKGTLFDTMIAHYLLHPELRHNMDYMADSLLNYESISIESLIGKKGKNQKTMDEVPLEDIAIYAAEDADITLQLKEKLEPELKSAGLQDLFREVECPLIYVLADMEFVGVHLDVGQLNNYAEKLSTELESIEKKIYEMTGHEFNISSPKQLGEILFDRLKITDKPPKTKTKQYSTSEETLQKLSDKHPVIREILEFRSVKKLLSTYVEALPKLINPETGKIHTSFNQTVAATGRLSSNNPNLQNIPIREIRGREIRKAFTASDENHVFLSADYSQIELRLMAHMSQDKHMLEAFQNEDTDIHAATAAKVYKVDVADVSREQRSKAKTANFGIIYGISAFGLSQRLNIPRTEAKQLIDDYFESFPGVKKYMDACIEEAKKNEFVETIMGRKRFLPDINSRNGVVRGMAERNAINAPIQGSAADIIKVAMINIYKRILNEGLSARLNLQVHDELNFECPVYEKDKLAEIVKYEMENAVHLSVPLTVDLGVGKDWLEAH
ncbi:MAG: DNA polymerase I [Bacteroidales bacterium]|jgi:DNA polymerase-1|nr:DNA polymerase I [Bacteroidales bacterium]